MPVKTKKAHHHARHDKHGHRRGKHFVKVYAPYIPLLLIVAFGLFMSGIGEFKSHRDQVLSYATQMSDSGLLESTNKERTSKGLKALAHNENLDKAAQAKAEDMAARNYWSHNTPDGKEPWIFIEQVAYKYRKAAENLAYGFDSSDSAVSGWMNSPSHRENVLDPVLSEVGFGIVNVPNYQNHGPQTVVVAMYGQPPTAVADAAIPLPVKDNPAQVAPAQKEEKITHLQTLTGGSAPWSTFVLGLVAGIVAMYLTTKHIRTLHRSVAKGERFILHHPLLDTTLIALLALAAIVSQTAGTIH